MSRKRQAYGKPLDGPRSTGVRCSRKTVAWDTGATRAPFSFAAPHDQEETMTLAETEDTPSFIYQEANYQPGRSWRTWLIGRPLSTADAPHQTIGKAIGLAVFASDALSSTAYATQEIMVILAAAGTMAFGLVFPDFAGDRGAAGYRDHIVRTDHPRLSGRRRRVHRGARQPGRSSPLRQPARHCSPTTS